MNGNASNPQAGAIIWYDGSIALRRTKHGRWLFPGGHIEQGEAAAEAALREAGEQTGLLVELLGALGCVTVHHAARSLTIQFFALRASGWGPHWQKHLLKDVFLFQPEQVADRLSFPELRVFWEEHRKLLLPRHQTA